jgi:tetratricopeptide (TPR) repeat protein
MQQDTVVSLYEMAEDLMRAGRLEEACQQYQTAYDLCKNSSEPDAESRRKIFAAKLGYCHYKLGRFKECKVFYDEIGKEMPKPPTNLRTVKQGVAAMKKLGFLNELTPKLHKKILEEAFGGDSELEGEGLPDFLTAYYGFHVEAEQAQTKRVTPLSSRALHDKFTWYDNRFANDSDDVVADFAELVGGPPLFVAKELDFYKKPFVVVLQDKDGNEVKPEIDDIDDIVELFNCALATLEDPQRFVCIESNGDYSCWMLVTATTFKELFRKGKAVFELVSIPGVVDEKSWLKAKAK